MVLADDEEAVRDAVRSLLQSVPGATVIAEAARGEDAVVLALQHQPDVVLMDISLCGVNGLDLTRQICREAPAVKVIILTAHTDHGYVVRAFEVGAVGFLVKATLAGELRTALESVMRGERFISACVRHSEGDA